MKRYLYVVMDNVMNESGMIFEAKNDEVAKRQYSIIVQGPHMNQNDFELLRLGRIDHDTNTIDCIEKKRIDLQLTLVEKGE